MPTTPVKNTDHVKLLAFRQLLRERSSPMKIRATLGISRATYFRYLKAVRRIEDAEKNGE